MRLALRLFAMCATVSAAFVVYAGGDDPVKGNEQGFWSNGFVLGTVFDAGTKGCILPSGEIKMYSGHYVRKVTSRRKKHYLSTYDKNVLDRLEEKALGYMGGETGGGNKVILSYVHPFPLNILHRNFTNYWVTDVQDLTTDFSQTPSGQKFAQDFEFAEEQEPPCSTSKGRIVGRIYHVSRWGLKSKVCTIYFQEERLTEVMESIPEHIDTTLSVSPSRDEKSSPFSVSSSASTYYRQERDFKHKSHGMNVYSETGCQFAEDAFKSQVSVIFTYSNDCCPLWNIYSGRVLKMRVLKKKTD